MALLDTYFIQLQEQTGTNQVVLVRDDPIQKTCTTKPAAPSGLGKKQRCRSWHPSLAPIPSGSRRTSCKSRPEFQPDSQMEEVVNRPPCQPKRIESQDDICTATIKRMHNRRENGSSCPSETSGDRIRSLFGADMAMCIEKSKRNSDPVKKLGGGHDKLLKNLAAPAFPMRKGSRDDLSALKSSCLHLNQQFSNSMLNDELELTKFLDQVSDTLGRVNAALNTSPTSIPHRRHSANISPSMLPQLPRRMDGSPTLKRTDRWVPHHNPESMEVLLGGVTNA
eukprot:Nitzschia sp. Nitz4//scaffold27_size158506//129788//130627//NITZ4_002619-RA/size158506-processed-gene-0.56-mRNA-1//1//CDS//3329545545//4549//frame0